jgi:pimeloyl-ACP methyl ester carboxylesterase
MTDEAASIRGPLYAEALGSTDAPAMVFVHPNPMDSTSWLFQMAHFSTWYRCIAVDLPGYGRSPRAGPGLTMREVAAACWRAVDARGGTTPSVLVGCSVGAAVVQHMYHLRPAATDIVVLCGTGWWESKEFAHRHIAAYRQEGVGYRRRFTLGDFSEAFRTTPLAAWFASLFAERNAAADVETIINLLTAHAVPDPAWLQAELRAPVLLVSGGMDNSHPAAIRLRDRLPEVEMVTIEDAGHACHMEQPWAFDRAVISFLRRRGHLHLPDVDALVAG